MDSVMNYITYFGALLCFAVSFGQGFQVCDIFYSSYTYCEDGYYCCGRTYCCPENNDSDNDGGSPALDDNDSGSSGTIYRSTGLNTGTVVGIVIGCVCFTIIVVVLIAVCYSKLGKGKGNGNIVNVLPASSEVTTISPPTLAPPGYYQHELGEAPAYTAGSHKITMPYI